MRVPFYNSRCVIKQELLVAPRPNTVKFGLNKHCLEAKKLIELTHLAVGVKAIVAFVVFESMDGRPFTRIVFHLQRLAY